MNYHLIAKYLTMFLYSWLISFLILITIDGIWLTLMGHRFYMHNLSQILSGSVNVPLVVLFYFIYSFGITYLILIPAIREGITPNIYVFIRGFILGLLSYAAYNLTNQATISNWPLIVSITDTLWGATMTGSITIISYIILLKI